MSDASSAPFGAATQNPDLMPSNISSPSLMVVEAALQRMWCELLHVDEIYADDDFFELGGDSLSAIRLIELIGREFGEELLEPDVIFTASKFVALRDAVLAAQASAVGV